MFEYKLLTKKDLAKRWQLDERTIDKYRTEGILTPCKGVLAVRFSPQYITELEGVKLEKFSPIERRRLEIKIEELEQENRLLKQVWLRIFSESANIAPLIK